MENFRCTECNANGNAIHFIKYAEGIDYFDAIKLQAERLGIEIPEELRHENIQIPLVRQSGQPDLRIF